MVDGFPQDPLDGISMVYTFADAMAPGRKHTQYFDNNGSRAIYHDGWFACTFGPLTPWLTISPGLATWDSRRMSGKLYDLKTDFSQANDLAAKDPQRLDKMQGLFLREAEANKAFPIGAGHLASHSPGRSRQDLLRHKLAVRLYHETHARVRRTRPGRESNQVTIDAELGETHRGVPLRAGGAGGGLTLYMDNGQLVYEYNMMNIERYSLDQPTSSSAGNTPD